VQNKRKFKSPANKKSNKTPPTPNSEQSTSSTLSEYMLTWQEAWKLLQELSFRYSSFYRPPNTNPKNKTGAKFENFKQMIWWVYDTEFLEGNKAARETLGGQDFAQLDEYVTAEGREMERTGEFLPSEGGGKRERVKRRIGSGTSPLTTAAKEAEVDKGAKRESSRKEREEKAIKEKAKMEREAKSKTEEERRELERLLQRTITDQSIFGGLWPEMKKEGWDWGKVRLDKDRSNELETRTLATKTARTRTFVQDALPP